MRREPFGSSRGFSFSKIPANCGVRSCCRHLKYILLWLCVKCLEAHIVDESEWQFGTIGCRVVNENRLTGVDKRKELVSGKLTNDVSSRVFHAHSQGSERSR